MGNGRQQGIAREDAGQLVRYLCWRAKVGPVAVDWNGRHVRGQHKPGRIAIGPRIRDGLAAVIHEVAHHVVAERSGETRRRKYKYRALYPGLRGPRVVHGPLFVAVLRELAGYWYGDPARYPWETEYRSIRAAGKGPR
jgi:hypothetical protein